MAAPRSIRPFSGNTTNTSINSGGGGGGGDAVDQVGEVRQACLWINRRHGPLPLVLRVVHLAVLLRFYRNLFVFVIVFVIVIFIFIFICSCLFEEWCVPSRLR